jgi:hypothetical protein
MKIHRGHRGKVKVSSVKEKQSKKEEVISEGKRLKKKTKGELGR